MSTTQNALVGISYAATPGFPAGSAVDHILVTCVGATGGAQPSQSVPGDTASVTFPNLPPDTYTFTAQAFPATGAGFGSPAVSAPLTIVAPATVSLDLPQAISASQP